MYNSVEGNSFSQNLLFLLKYNKFAPQKNNNNSSQGAYSCGQKLSSARD